MISQRVKFAILLSTVFVCSSVASEVKASEAPQYFENIATTTPEKFDLRAPNQSGANNYNEAIGISLTTADVEFPLNDISFSICWNVDGTNGSSTGNTAIWVDHVSKSNKAILGTTISAYANELEDCDTYATSSDDYTTYFPFSFLSTQTINDDSLLVLRASGVENWPGVWIYGNGNHQTTINGMETGNCYFNTGEETYNTCTYNSGFGNSWGLPHYTMNIVPVTNNDCTTCTRFLSSSLEQDTDIDLLPFPTPYDINFYVNDDDFAIEDNDIVAKITIKHVLNSYDPVAYSTETHEFILQNDGLQSVGGLLSEVTADGTYTVDISIYGEDTGFWNYFDRNRVYYDSELFTIFRATSTTQEQAINVASTTVNGENDPDFLETKFNDFKHTLLYAWPLGYAMFTYDILRGATSTATSSIVITHTVPMGMPGEGSTITLNAGTGLQDAVSNINALTISTIDGQPVDVFLSYWEMLWKIIFAFWLIKELWGTFGVSFGQERTTYHRENRRQEQNQEKYKEKTYKKTGYHPKFGFQNSYSMSKRIK